MKPSLRIALLTDDRGSALLLALAFLLLFSLFISTLLAFGYTSERVSEGLTSQRATVYTSDGAVEGAVNYLRGNVNLGVYPLTTSCDFTLPASVNQVPSVPVTCSPQVGSGAVTGGGSTPSNAPAQAILTRETGGNEGIQQLSNSGLNVQGDVFSNSIVQNTASKAAINVAGALGAVGACSGTINATPGPVSCNQGVAAAKPDPGYPAAISSVPNGGVPTSVPACSAGALVTFGPGYYADASALTNLMNGSCSPNTVFWFQPGNYYFDFTNTTGGHVWTINDAKLHLIAGTPKGWATSPLTAPPFPGACETDADTTSPNTGVQFVFGGDSRINVTAGKVEICAQPSTTSQEIAIFGLPSGASSPSTVTLASSGASTPAGDQGFNPPNDALSINSVAASALAKGATTGKGATPSVPAGINLTGYGAIPTSATISAVKLRIVHGESTTTGVSSLQATISSSGLATPITIPNKTGSCSASQNLCIQAPGGSPPVLENDIDLYTLGMTTPAAFSGLSIKYEANASSNKSFTEYLDGIALDVTYTVSLNAESGCITTRPYPTASGSCALITTNGAQTSFAVQGTVYAPLAPLDISLTNASYQAFTRGVISWMLRVSITPALTCGGSCPPTFSLPGGGPTTYAPRDMILTAHGKGTSGPPTLRAEIQIIDGPGPTRTPGVTVKVLSWDVLR